MRCALYLRPAGIAATPHFDDRVKAWLREQGYEPVDGGEHDVIVCLPYCAGGGLHGRDVSIAMAQRMLEFLAVDGEVLWIRLIDTDVDWRDNSLQGLDLAFEGHGIACKPTLAILSEADAAEADLAIRRDVQFGGDGLGIRWRP